MAPWVGMDNKTTPANDRPAYRSELYSAHHDASNGDADAVVV